MLDGFFGRHFAEEEETEYLGEGSHLEFTKEDDNDDDDGDDLDSDGDDSVVDDDEDAESAFLFVIFSIAVYRWGKNILVRPPTRTICD